jgi:hypothetical protein
MLDPTHETIKKKGHIMKFWFDDQCREERKQVREAITSFQKKGMIMIVE